MRYSLIFLLIFTTSAHAFKYKGCEELEKAERLLDPDEFKNEYRKTHALTGKEAEVNFTDYSQAKAYVFNHPIFDDLKFGKVSSNSQTAWKPYKSTNDKAKWYQKVNGWEKKLPDGGYARVRIDWAPFDVKNPKLGGRAHINVEFSKIKNANKNNEYKMAVNFECGPTPCMEQDVNKLISQMSHLENRAK